MRTNVSMPNARAGTAFLDSHSSHTSSRAGHAKKLLEQALEVADVRIDGGRPWDIRVHNPAFYTEALPRGVLGVGEAYMDGWWDSDQLDELSYRVMSARCEFPLAGKLKLFAVTAASYLLNAQSRRGSRRIREHYNLGNDLFQAMLDQRMVYSCGYWRDAATLDEAQEAKLDLVCRKCGLQPGMRVLDIGCGWGSFAKFAAERYGVSVTGITICEEQLSLGREMCAGIPVELRLQDYRDLSGSYDAVVSIGMFEHVGVKNYRQFMKIVRRVLKRDGIFLLHTIGGEYSVRSGDPWMNRYIFPNGMLPSAEQITQACERVFRIDDWHNFGPDYDRTALAWFRNFDASWHALRERYGDRFYRMWKFYLQSCAGVFRARRNQVWQIALLPVESTGRYESIR